MLNALFGFVTMNFSYLILRWDCQAHWASDNSTWRVSSRRHGGSRNRSHVSDALVWSLTEPSPLCVKQLISTCFFSPCRISLKTWRSIHSGVSSSLRSTPNSSRNDPRSKPTMQNKFGEYPWHLINGLGYSVCVSGGGAAIHVDNSGKESLRRWTEVSWK